MYESISSEIRAYLLSLFLFKENVSEPTYFQYLYMLSNHTVQNYKVIHLKKRNGRIRTIYEPCPMLKYIQRRLLDTVLKEVSPSDSATAYKKNFSIVDNALPHVGKKKLLKLDIHHFFDCISFLDVYESCFYAFPKRVGTLFTSLCCYADFLPQGAPTSSYISNIVMRDFDFVIKKYAEEKGITYTRYSDDMTFSGEEFNHQELISFVKENLKKKRLFLNQKKTKIFYQNTSLQVTGLVVNEKINLKKSYLKRIRQEMYYIKKFGLASHLFKIGKKDKEAYLLRLKGKVNFVIFVTHKKEFYKYKEVLDKIK